MERCGNNSPRAASRCFGFGTTCDIVEQQRLGAHGACHGSFRRRTSFGPHDTMEDTVVATGVLDGSLVSNPFVGKKR
jgi:hypothetical protein